MKKKAAKKEKVYPGSAAKWILPLLLALLAITNTAIATATPLLPQTRVRDFFSQTQENRLGKLDLTQHNNWGNLRFSEALAPGSTSFHKDHLGSTAVVTDSMGNHPDGEPEYTVYQPYGLPRPGSELSSKSDYAFTDQEMDRSTGFYNYDARLYNPEIGMFITADSVLPDAYDPQQLNRYAYAKNNPIIYIDPDGNVTKLALGGVLEGTKNRWGHVSIIINDKVYSYFTRWSGKKDWGVSVQAYFKNVNNPDEIAQDDARATLLLELDVTEKQERELEAFLNKKVPNFEDASALNSCVTKTDRALTQAGILEPNYAPGGTEEVDVDPITPAGLGKEAVEQGLVKSVETRGTGILLFNPGNCEKRVTFSGVEGGRLAEMTRKEEYVYIEKETE